MTLAVAKIFKTAPLLSYVSIGDLKGMIIKPSGTIQNLKSQNGIVGYTMPKTIVTNIIKIHKFDMIVFNTDGVSINQKEISPSTIVKSTKDIAEEFAKKYFKEDDDSLALVLRYKGFSNSLSNQSKKLDQPITFAIDKQPIILKNKYSHSSHYITKLDDSFKLIVLLASDVKVKEKLYKILDFFTIDKKNIIKNSLFLLEIQEIEKTPIHIYYHNKIIQFSIEVSNDYKEIISSSFKFYLVHNNQVIIDILTNDFVYEENQFNQFQELLKFGLDEEAMVVNKKLQEEVDKKLNELLEQENLNSKLSNKAYIDNLTGAFNRYKFEEVFAYEMERLKRFQHTFCIAMIDIDHFKNFNDTFGHLIGDEVLIMLARQSKKVLRSIDIFARWGGEEFLILFTETSIEDSIKVANKLRESIAALEHETAGHITASFGVSQIDSNDSLDDILKRCDDALYRAKGNGRNRVEVEIL